MSLGGIKNASNPKTRKFRKEQTNGNIILDPEVQLNVLNEMHTMIQQAKKDNKEIVIVSLKSGLKDIVKSLAEKHDVHYLVEKLPGGFLTNFETLFRTIKTMNDQKQFMESESFTKLTKKEQTMNKRHLEKIENIYGGVKNLKKKPDMVIVVDGTMLSSLINEITITETESIVLNSTDFSQYWQGNNMAIVNLHNQKSPHYILETLFA